MASNVPAATLARSLHNSVLEEQREGCSFAQRNITSCLLHPRDSTTLQAQTRTCEPGRLAPCLITLTTIVVGRISPRVELTAMSVRKDASKERSRPCHRRLVDSTCIPTHPRLAMYTHIHTSPSRLAELPGRRGHGPRPCSLPVASGRRAGESTESERAQTLLASFK